jgi:hypothetical protein
MKSMRVVTALTLCCVLLIYAPALNGYVFCGSHDGPFSMIAYHWNSTFWTDMLVAEAAKWNTVHSVLNIAKLKAGVPLGKDNINVISWINEVSLLSAYGLSWSGTVGWTISWKFNGCGLVDEADVFFNPAITLFTPQTQVPYSLGYQEIALHELGHVVTLDHEDGSLAVMTSNNAVSNVMYHNDKVGWLRSADILLSVTDKSDMGIFPLRNAPGTKVYSTLSPTTVPRGSNVTIRDLSVQNLSSGLAFSGPAFRVTLEKVSGGAPIDIGGFSWGSFCAFCGWSGNLSFTVPNGIAVGTYRVVGTFSGSDSDAKNNRAVFGTIAVS